MVAIMAVHQPQLGDVAELDVLGNLLRNEVAVIVYDGHVLGTAVVQLSRKVVGEHEIFVDE